MVTLTTEDRGFYEHDSGADTRVGGFAL